MRLMYLEEVRETIIELSDFEKRGKEDSHFVITYSFRRLDPDATDPQKICISKIGGNLNVKSLHLALLFPEAE